MLDKPNQLQWHPAFFAATCLEFKENTEQLELIGEYNLSKMPLKIDILVLKDRERPVKVKNEIGHIMKTYNVIEYKSPEEALSIDDFYKAIGYACIYKSEREHVNEAPIEEITVSFFRDHKPRKLFTALKNSGFVIECKYKGIYYVRGAVPFATQVIVIKELEASGHLSLKVLSNRAKRVDIERFLEKARRLTEPGDKDNIDSILQVSVAANHAVYDSIRKEDPNMCEALRELMKDEIEEAVSTAVADAVSEEKLESIKKMMNALNMSADQAMDVLEIPAAKRVVFLTRL